MLTIRKAIMLPPDLLEAVDDYRRRQRPVPNESEAIRQLIRLGLELADQCIGSFEGQEAVWERKKGGKS